MDKSRYSIFKYRHRQSVSFTPGQQRRIIAGLLIAGLVFLYLSAPAGVVCGFILLVYLIRIWPLSNQLLLGPRYLICGNRVLYYANIAQLGLPAPGRLEIREQGDMPLILTQDDFPTNARKPDKIARNKQAKFDKVKLRILEKVVAANPAVELVGLKPSEFTRRTGAGTPS